MAEVVTNQIRLRRAFRYGYFAFIAVVVAFAVLLGFWLFDRDVVESIVNMMPDRDTNMMLVLAFGLCVPLFFAVWSLIGTAVLGADYRQPPLGDRRIPD